MPGRAGAARAVGPATLDPSAAAPSRDGSARWRPVRATDQHRPATEGGIDLNAAGPSTRKPVTFCVLVLALSVPFWLLGAVVTPPALPIDLPVSALQFVCPLIAAVILVHHEEGRAGVLRLLLRVVDVGALTPRIWYLPTVLLMPAVLLLSYGVMLLLGRPLPEPDIPLSLVPVLVVVFFVAAGCEEAGWSGYVLQPLQDRWGAAVAGVVLGAVWGAWHVVAWFVQGGHTATWTAGQFLGSVALRVLIVWLYNNTGGSILAAVLFHDMINVSEFLFPNHGSHYDPVVTAAILVVVAGLVTLVWGPRSLAGRAGSRPARPAPRRARRRWGP